MENLGIADMFKKSFLAMSGTADQLTPIDIVMNIAMTFMISMFIFYMYKRTFQGVLYQRSFNISLVMASTVTSVVIMTISGNIVLSLGMVGALSIVRFRTPIKDSMDLVFLFWAISVGIANGVGYYNISIIGSIMISLILLVLTRKEETSPPFLLVIQAGLDVDENKLISKVNAAVSKYSLKSKMITDTYHEWTIEVKLHNDNTEFLNELRKEGLVNKATLISYSGDLAAA